MILVIMMSVPMPTMTVVKKDVLVAAVYSESYRGYAKAWKSALESVESRKRTSVPP